jgi:hypothetical protein
LVKVFRGNARRRVADVTPLADSGSQEFTSRSQGGEDRCGPRCAGTGPFDDTEIVARSTDWEVG